MNKIILINKIRRAIKNYIPCILDYRMYFKNLKAGRDTSSKGPTRYYLRNGLKFQTRKGTGDVFVLCEICATDVYNINLIKQGDIVVDIGAHIGIFSIMASNKAEKVISLEPIKDNFSLLRRNIFLNNKNNIFPIRKALSSRTGKVEIYTGDNTVAHSLINKRNKSSSISVDTISLKDLIKSQKIKKIDFLKMDCEGAEYDVLYNLQKSVLKIIKVIHLEAHKIDEKRNREKMASFLKDNNFLIKKKYGLIYALNKDFKEPL